MIHQATDPLDASDAEVERHAASIPHHSLPLSGMRKTIAHRMSEAKRVPHFYLSIDVKMDGLLQLRTELNAELEKQGKRLSVNDMLIRALALALEAQPQCNVAFMSDRLIRYQRVDIGVAVSVPNGLITPIIVDAVQKTPGTIAAEMRDLAERARAGRLKPHEYQGGTATLSNMGMYGIKQFQAIINPPQSMIMAVGAAEKRGVCSHSPEASHSVMTATGSFDHRAIDGADGGELMRSFRNIVEDPMILLS